MPKTRSTALRLATIDGDAAPGPRPKGSRRPHRNEMVARVRRLIETTPQTYAEIAAATGVARATICRWTRDAGWKRHLFAPRATDTVPRERAGAQLKMRTLAARLAALAERHVRELEASAGVDTEKLAEAFALYQMTRLALRRRRPRRKSSKLKADLRRLYPRENSSPPVPAPSSGHPRAKARSASHVKSGDPVLTIQPLAAHYPRAPGSKSCEPYDLSALAPDTPPYLRLWMELANAGIDMDRAPHEAVTDFIKSRIFEDLGKRPKNRTRKQRRADWLRERE